MSTSRMTSSLRDSVSVLKGPLSGGQNFETVFGRGACMWRCVSVWKYVFVSVCMLIVR